jgi:hypothetical protein
MASPAVHPTSALPLAPLPELRSAARAIFGGLLWGAALLIVLALWLGFKNPEGRAPVLPWVVAALGVASLALAIWHAFTLWFQKLPAEQIATGLAGQRRATAVALLGGGAAMVVLAGILAFVSQTGGDGGMVAFKANFGESVGLFLLALVTLGTGRALLNPPRDRDAAVDLTPVRNMFPLIRIALFALGLASVGTFIVLVFIKKVGGDNFPELSGLLLLSMLCLAVGLWLTTIPVPDSFTTRIFVLGFGGSIGLILFIVSIGRAYVWRNVVFSNIAIWQGPNAWQLWLCVYLQVFALALMFGSLLLARSDIRGNVVLRRVLFGYSAVVEGLLLVEMLVVANIVVNAMVPYTFDWSDNRGLQALSESSKNLLHELKQPAHAYVLMSQNSASYNEVRNLLENMRAESDKFDVKYISPDRMTFDYESLAKKFPQILPAGGPMRGDDSGRGILLVYGDMPTEEKHKVPYTFIQEKKIYDEIPAGMQGGKPKRLFKGEVEVARELNFLLHGKKKRKVYFLQGDDELDIAMTDTVRRIDPRDELSLFGAAMLMDKLKKDNYEVQGMTFSKTFAGDGKKGKSDILFVGEKEGDKKGAEKKPAAVPKDAYAVVVLGASNTIPPAGLDALGKYMDGGGRMLVLFDLVLTNDVKSMKFSGMEEFVKKYGIESTNEFALRVVERGDPYTIVATGAPKSENTLAKQLQRSGVQIRTVRVIRPAVAAGRLKAAPVMVSIPKFTPAVAEKDVSVVKDPIRFLVELQDQGVLLERMSTPLPVVVGVSEDDKGRMVVFGDTEFVGNVGLAQDRSGENYSLFVSALEWLADRDATFVGPRPKETGSYALPKTVAAEYTRIYMTPMWLMLLTIIGVGTGIWLVRRR